VKNRDDKGPRDTQFDEAHRQLGEGLRPRQLATGIQRDQPPSPGPYIRLPNMVQTTKSTFKDLTGRTGRSGKMDARGVELYR
jgi:hypothetical protein